jgi:type IV pilus assembly protein PilM
MSKSLITGVDIQSNGIVTVTLQLDKRGYSLIGHRAFITPIDIVTDLHANKHQELVKKLKQLKSTLSLFQRKIAMALDDGAVISKPIELESRLSPYEFKDKLYQEFAQHSPLPMDELCIDFIEQPSCADERGSLYHVYAAKKLIVDQRANLASESGLSLAIIDIERQALIQLLQHAQGYYQRKDWLFINVRHSTLSFCYTSPKHPMFFKQIHLSLSTPLNEQQSIELHAKVRREMIGFKSRYPEIILEGVWVAGATTDIGQVIESVMGCENGLLCEVLRPLTLVEHNSMLVAESNKIFDADQGRYALAFGVALRGLAALEGGYAA